MGLTRTPRGSLHELAQLLVHHGMPKRITTYRLPAATAAGGGGNSLHCLHAVVTDFGGSRNLLQ